MGVKMYARALAAALTLGFVFPGFAQADDPGALTRLLEAQLARMPAKSGIYIKHLATGEEGMVKADEHFESASTIKLATMVIAFQMADAGKLKLDERVELTPAVLRGGSGIYRYKDLGLRPTIRDLITEMVITSDNTATDLMIAKVGGKERVNAWLKDAGYQVLNQTHTTGEYFRLIYAAMDPKYANLSMEDVFALCCADTTVRRMPVFSDQRKALIDEVRALSANRSPAPSDSNDEGRWFGAASPREMGRLVESVERCTVAKPESCDEMRRMLRAQQAGTMKIPHYLTVPVGHKTGETTGVTNDVGVIYAKSGPIVISFYNMNMTGSRADTEDMMGEVARSVVDYFDGVRK
ncbi:MAG: class A beta-lactamase-related serine hydrolase [Proteobacteria bacterium]|nr:class A beta-lactamase-related serine hydrolase [Pseudomonadota bacterium]